MFSDMNQLFERLANSKFRSSFHLKRRELSYFNEKGLDTIMEHAKNLLQTRLFAADIPNDGKQTPMKNHPVFIAQHATGCCCRGCLEKWHAIPKGRELTPDEQQYVLAVIREWLVRETTSK